MPLWEEKWVVDALKQADQAAYDSDHAAIANSLKPIPNDLFLLFYFADEIRAYPNLNNWLSPMPPQEDQIAWAGNSGIYLMQQASAFIERLIFNYRDMNGDLTTNTTFLDYGCGWGRLLRVLYKYANSKNLYGVDPWPPSIERCKKYNVHANLSSVDYVPERLYLDRKMDVIFSYSVFTHISESAQKAILKQWHNIIAPDGLVGLTIRQSNYWTHTNEIDEIERMALAEQHATAGFAHRRHSDEDTMRAKHYGDTSLTLEYIEREWTDWKIKSVDWVMLDEYQTYVFLTPVK